MLGNDRYGNCVAVAELRAIEMRRANANGDGWKPTEAQALGLYGSLTGFDPITGQPDNGTDTVVAMTKWCVTGVRVNEQDEDLVFWASVDPTNVQHCQLAAAHTGPVQITLALPDAAQDLTSWAKEPGIGPAWAAGSWGCHRVISGKYYGEEFVVRTWGQDVAMHPKFWSSYVIAVDVSLSREWLNTTGVSPAGLDWAALELDMMQLRAA